jgi:LemA protein
MLLLPIVLGVLGLLLLWAAVSFNLMVRDRNRLREAWSGIDVQLKRRADLVPALVEVVKGYAGHEKKLFTDVAALRSPKEVVEGLKTVLAYVENYPQLKADKNFLDLQKNLSGVEDDLQYARRYYNGTVRDYNSRIQSFPNLLLAKPAGFAEQKFFEVDYVTERKSPDVAF